MSEIENYLGKEPNGMAIYEYIVNHSDSCLEDMPELTKLLCERDPSGQFLASSARYLHAVDTEGVYAPWISKLIESAIDKDRERRYIGSLLQGIWGADYQDRVDILRETDDNFRRIYKRIYPMQRQPRKEDEPDVKAEEMSKGIL